MNIIIPLGGKGERFKNNGYDLPKPLIKIFEKEMIFYVLDNLKINKEDKIFIIYYNLHQYNFENIILKKYSYIEFIQLEKQTKGASETIMEGLQKIKQMTNNKKCLLLDCDTFYTENIIEMYNNINYNAIFYTNNIETNPIYSYILIDENNNVKNITEKVKISNNANTGIYCFNDIEELHYYSKYIVDNDINFNNECYTSCIIKEMINNNKVFKAIKLNNENVFNLGTPLQLTTYINNTHLFLFDLDGTMVLTDENYYSVWKQILVKYNIELTHELFSKYIVGNSDSTVLRTLLSITDKETIKTISLLKDELFLQNLCLIKIIDGVIMFLQTIKMNGHKIAIVTNCNRMVANEILKHTKIIDYIDLVISGDECINSKPHPEPYLIAIKFFNSSNKKTIIFEDSKTGLNSAKNTFPKCLIGIETLYDSNELINCGVDLCIKNYNNIKINNILNYNNMNISKIKKYIQLSLPNININDIIIDEQKLKGGFISDVISLKIKTNTNVLDCVLKLENKNETFLSKMANELGLYEREDYFYNNLSKYVSLKIPEFYGLIKDDNFSDIGILMNNLTNLDYKLNLNLNIEKIDTSLIIIDRLAQLHSKFWNKDLQKNFKELKKHNDIMFNPKWSNFIKSQYDKFKSKWTGILTLKDIEKAQYIVDNFQNIQNNLSDNNLTLCHGDVKSANIFYKLNNNNYEPYFIDWQYISIGKGVQDLVFFMIESFEIDKINVYKNIFKDYYYVKLLEYGVTNYSINDYNRDFENSMYYFPFFVAIWFGTVDEDELIDKNFPFFFIKKLFNFLDLKK